MIEWDQTASYRISPENKKQIVMKKIYYKSDDYDQKITSIETFRSGWVEVDGEEMSFYLDDLQYIFFFVRKLNDGWGES